MKVLSCFFVGCLFCASLWAATPVEINGKLSVQGPRLVNEQGSPVALRGMSMFWSQWMSKYYVDSTVDWLVDDWKVQVLRVAMAVESGGYLVQPELEKQRAATVIDACIRRGIYVIIDWHDHKAVDHLDASKAFFTEMASRYGNFPNVLYEPYNEPLNTHRWEAVKAYHEQVVSAIRAVDPDNVILLGSPTWDQDVDVAASDPLTGVTNVAYTFHFYASDPFHQERLRAKADKAIAQGLCLFVSEWGVSESSGNGAFDKEKTDAWVRWMDKNGLSWCNWSLADKQETSAALKPGASPQGGWSEDMLTPSGAYIRGLIRGDVL